MQDGTSNNKMLINLLGLIMQIKTHKIAAKEEIPNIVKKRNTELVTIIFTPYFLPKDQSTPILLYFNLLSFCFSLT
jgi:hypothetical protein